MLTGAGCGFQPAKLLLAHAFSLKGAGAWASLAEKKGRPKRTARNIAVSTTTARLPTRPMEDHFVLRFANEVKGVNEFSQNLKFEAWSNDPVVLRQQIDLALNRRPKKKKRKYNKARPEPNRFWELAPWQQRFISTLPRSCECTNNFELGTRFKERDLALHAAHIQVNTPMIRRYIVADLDMHNAAEAHVRAGVATPNIIAINPANGHAHVFYELASPVTYFARSKWSCISFAADVQRGLFRRLNADLAYNDGLPKNPVSDWWEVRHLHDQPYSLRDLAASLNTKDMRARQKGEREIGIGRNVTLFNELRSISYGRVVEFVDTGRGYNDFLSAVFVTADDLNRSLDFETPLPASEVRSVSKSVAGWTWERAEFIS